MQVLKTPVTMPRNNNPFQGPRIQAALDREKQEKEAEAARNERRLAEQESRREAERRRTGEAAAAQLEKEKEEREKDRRVALRISLSQKGRDLAADAMALNAEGRDWDPVLVAERVAGIRSGKYPGYVIPDDLREEAAAILAEFEAAGEFKSAAIAGAGTSIERPAYYDKSGSGSKNKTKGKAASAPSKGRSSSRKSRSHEEDEREDAGHYPGHGGADNFEGEDLGRAHSDGKSGELNPSDQSEDGEEEDLLDRSGDERPVRKRGRVVRSPSHSPPGRETRLAPREEPAGGQLVTVRG